MEGRAVRVLHCQRYGWPYGGAETYVFRLMRATADSGNRAALLTYSDPRNRRVRGIQSYEITPDARFGAVRRKWKQIEAILKKEKPDLIHLHEGLGFLGPYVIRRLRRQFPLVLTIHFAGFFCPKGGQAFEEIDVCLRSLGPHCIRCVVGSYDRKAMLSNYLRLILLRKASATAVGSLWLRDLALGHGFPAERTWVLPPYWHTPQGEAASPRGSDEILFVGRIIEAKGIFHLVEALAPLRSHSWRMLIIGQGQDEKKLWESITMARLDSRISLTGFVPHESIWEYYKRGAFLVMPSLFPETFGIAGAEAMSAGLPVIAYDAGGVSDWLVHGRNGLLVKRGDIQGLTQAIRKLLEDPNLRQAMGRAAHEDMSSRYSRESHMERLYRIYDRALTDSEG